MTGAGRGWWMLRYSVGKKSSTGKTALSREMGLGGADPAGVDGFTLAEARDRAEDARRQIRNGLDPLAQREATKVAEKRAATAAMTFRQAAEAYIPEAATGWRNAKHAGQWKSTLEAYAYPIIGHLPVSAIGLDEVKQILAPIWTTKTETAGRVRGRVEAVLDYAQVHGWRTGDNPARWKGNLQLAGFQPRSKVAPVEHHAALAWQDAPAFLTLLRGQSAVAARALEFLILTAARTGEVIGAKWSEVSLEAGVWTIPPARMKAKREHRVALSAPALAVLYQVAKLRPEGQGDAYLFPGMMPRKPLSSMAMLKLLGRMGRSDVTPHGMRSTFRDWAGETTNAPREVVEMALAHRLGDKAEQAYARGDLFAKRRALMDAWGAYCGPATQQEAA